MTNLNVTGNEAQFNEKVTFLKDVDLQGNLEIKGTLTVPPLPQLTIDNLTVSNIFGNPETTFHNRVNFLDSVSFAEALSFTDLELRDRLAVGVGGTVLVADSRLNPGKVGIGSTNPTELLDVGGKAKIIDLEIENLRVAGLSTFVGISSFQDNVIFNGSGGISSVFFDKSNNRLKFVDESKATFGTGNDLEISHTISLKDQLDSNGDSVVDGRTSLIEESGSGGLIFKSNGGDGPGAYQFFDQSWQPLLKMHGGNNARVALYNAGIKKFRTTGIGVSVLGDLIVPDVGGRVSRVGLGTTFPANPLSITDLDNAGEGELRLDVKGSISVSRNIYDSSGSPGANNYWLRRDELGIKWVALTPGFDEGIFIQDEGQFLPTDENHQTVGAAQSFTTINFVQRNSLGLGTDTLRPTAADPTFPGTGLSTIFTNDLWGYNGVGNNASIFRMTKVGVNNSNPTYQVDINGDLHAVQQVQFDDTLTVNKHTELKETLNVGAAATFNDNVTITADDKFFKIQTDAGIDKFTVDTNNGNTDIKGTLDVKLETVLKDTLDVTGAANFNLTDDASNSTTGGSVTIDGGAAVAKKLFVGTDFNVKGNTQLGDTSNDTLTVNATSTFKANVTAEKNVDIDENLDVDGHTELDDLNVTGFSTFGPGITTQTSTLFANQFSVAGVSTFIGITTQRSTLFANQLSVVGFSTFIGITTQTSTLFANQLSVAGFSTFIGITTQKSTMFMKQSSTSGVATFKGTVDLDGAIQDINDDTGFSDPCKTDYRLASVGTGVSWRPSGVQTKRTIWVTKNGCDTNSGLLEGDAKATIGAAAAVALPTDTIKIRPGVYEENNPIGLRTDVTVTGEDIRLVIIQSQNRLQNVFHVRRGCLIENLNFGGSNVGVGHDGAACVAFPPPSGSTTGFTDAGPANEGPSGRWRSPYIRNCTNFMTGSIGMKIDGNDARADYTGTNIIGADLKSMVCDSFTQYNENGIGVSLTNNAYAQLVSIFTINTDIGIYADTGAQCDLTNSNSSFGNFGLVAVGLGSTEFTGIVSNTNPAGELILSTTPEEQDVVVGTSVTDLNNQFRRPFDGQALYFKIKASNYGGDFNTDNLNAGTLNSDGRITAPLQQLDSIKLNSGVDLTGFSAIDPPDVLIRDADGTQEPKGPQGIIAEATATVSPAGLLTEINVVAQGRNYLSGQNIVVDVEGDTSLATAVMSPIYYTVEEATDNTIGITSITFNEFIPYELFPDDPFTLQRISRILTSSHSFEYVGTGTAINKSVPLQGAIPIKANEVVAKDGAQIPFTSTDQKGNFDIGEGLQINQTTSTISGRDFSRSLQAEVTPLILALR